jgi:hypothetical protein
MQTTQKQLRYNLLRHLEASHPSPMTLEALWREENKNDPVLKQEVRDALSVLVNHRLARRQPANAALPDCWCITGDGLALIEDAPPSDY